MSVSKLSPKQQADVIIKAKSDEITVLKAAVSKTQAAFENLKTAHFADRAKHLQNSFGPPKAEGSVQIGTPNCLKGIVSVFISPNSSTVAKVAAYIATFFTTLLGFGSYFASELDRQLIELETQATVATQNLQISRLIALQHQKADAIKAIVYLDEPAFNSWKEPQTPSSPKTTS